MITATRAAALPIQMRAQGLVTARADILSSRAFNEAPLFFQPSARHTRPHFLSRCAPKSRCDTAGEIFSKILCRRRFTHSSRISGLSYYNGGQAGPRVLPPSTGSLRTAMSRVAALAFAGGHFSEDADRWYGQLLR